MKVCFEILSAHHSLHASTKIVGSRRDTQKADLELFRSGESLRRKWFSDWLISEPRMSHLRCGMPVLSTVLNYEVYAEACIIHISTDSEATVTPRNAR